MRYNIEEFIYNGSEIHVKGWGLPEHKGDALKVYLRDAEKNILPVSISYISREDVTRALRGEETDEQYGFSFDYPVKGNEILEIYFDAEQFDIDFARKTLKVKEAVDAYKKNRRRKPR